MSKFNWEEFTNVCLWNDKVRNLAVEPNADKKVVDSKRFALRADDLENRGEKMILEGGLF